MTELPAREKFNDTRRNSIPLRSSSSDVVSIWEIHHQVARLLVLGYKNVQIAQILGLTKERVSTIKNSPMIIRMTEMMKAEADHETIDIKRRIQEYAPKAFDVVKEVIEDETNSPGLRANYSLKMLNLAGHVAPKNVNVHSVNTNLSPDQIKMIRDRAAQIGMNSGLIVDESESDPS